MNAAPHATHEAKDRYYSVMDRPPHYTLPWTVVCPDGTVHGYAASRHHADETCDYLNAEDHTARAMTDTDRIAAIRANLDSYYEMRFPITEDEYRTVLEAIRDILS